MMANSLWDAWEKANQYQTGIDENTGAATYSLRPEYFTGSGRPQMQNAGYFSNIDEILTDPYYQNLGLTRDMIQSDGQGGFMVPTALSDKREISLNELAKKNAKDDIFTMAPLALGGLAMGGALSGAFGTMGGAGGIGGAFEGLAPVNFEGAANVATGLNSVQPSSWLELLSGTAPEAATGAGTWETSLKSLLPDFSKLAPNLSTPEGLAQFLGKQTLSTGITSLLKSGGAADVTGGGGTVDFTDLFNSDLDNYSPERLGGADIGQGSIDEWLKRTDPWNDLPTDGSGSSPLLDWLKKLSPNAWSSLLGAGVQGLGSLLASRTQQNAGDRALQLLRETNAQNRADTQPYRDAAIPALGNLTKMITPGNKFTAMEADPGYQWRMEQGQNALDNRLRSGGKFYSGSALKGGQDYAQGFASNEFGNVFNRNASVAGIGQTATNNTTNLNASTGNNLAGIEQGIGNVRASGYTGLGNAVQGGINAYDQSQYRNTLLSLLPQLIGKG